MTVCRLAAVSWAFSARAWSKAEGSTMFGCWALTPGDTTLTHKNTTSALSRNRIQLSPSEASLASGNVLAQTPSNRYAALERNADSPVCLRLMQEVGYAVIRLHRIAERFGYS
jgi:hypothetical protein